MRHPFLRGLVPVTILTIGLAAVLAAQSTRGPSAVSARVPAALPSAASGLNANRLARIDDVVAAAIDAKQVPGAVVIVGRGQAIAWRKAYGLRAVTPAPEPMTVDTVFDLASLTKVIATTPAVMQLIEDGRIRLNDPVAAFIPEFGQRGKERITIRDLMTHTSGLDPGLDLKTDWNGYDAAIRLASESTPRFAAGSRFLYSDVNFILLADIVARVSKESFGAYLRSHLFNPLGMRDTIFLPPSTLAGRVAPSDASVPRGTVHDPTARRMDGIAGHAGLFSTADDLAKFCRMLVAGGTLNGVRVLSPLSVGRMTTPATPSTLSDVRGLGWDIDTTYSAPRGDLLPYGSYGHTGFAGGSVWIDPATHVFVVILSNRLHPDGRGDASPIRAKVAAVAASALTDLPASVVDALAWSKPQAPASTGTIPNASAGPAPPAGPVATAGPIPPAAPSSSGGALAPSAAPPAGSQAASRGAAASTGDTLAGIDVLRANGFSELSGLRVGLLTNHTGRTRDGQSTIDVLASAPGVRLRALFSPEHGIRGLLDASVPSVVDEKTGLPIHSLYGETRRPTPAMLADLDAIVIDLQDIGTRFYTYMTTMGYVMEEAAARGMKVVVLDRPNPIGGVDVEGPPLDEAAIGFTGYFAPMPIRHGLTIGELARVFNGEKNLKVNLTVVPMQHWRREEWFDETGLTWVNPSPNMRTLYGATLYPGLGAIEQTNVSVGRGTDRPFEQIGAPWVDGPALAAALNDRHLPGVRFYAVSFTPTAGPFTGQPCNGVFIVVTDRSAVRAVRTGIEIASVLLRLFPDQFNVDNAVRLFGSASGLTHLKGGGDAASLSASWATAESRWRALTRMYWLY